jgi:adenylosuccinate lyase
VTITFNCDDDVIARYQLPEIARLFTDEARFALWLEVELLAMEGSAAIGAVPEDLVAEARKRAPVVDAAFVAKVLERERVTDHDVAAFVDVVQEAVGEPAARWIHYGLTSTDVVDTAQCATLTAASDLLIAAAGDLAAVLKRRALEFRATAMVGRTHGIHAEPTTFGAKLALWCLQVDRDRTRLIAARRSIAVGKLSGAVGTYSNIDPAVEAYVCAALGLVPVPSTQVVARDRHAEFLYACASVGATIELIATEVRHLQRTEVSEVREGFRADQKGSSAMPHKRNPITAERLCGLARVLRGNLVAGLENVALWHERDISHSSAERVILPDSAMLAYYVLRTAGRLIADLSVDPARMTQNLDSTRGLVFSQSVLLALIEHGLPRDEAYRIVQDDALRAWDGGRSFREILDADSRMPLDAHALDAAFSLDRLLARVGAVFAALDAVQP